VDLLSTVFYTLLALALLISFHEFGHFFVARICEVKVICFSIGFGPKVLSWRDSRGTEFVLSALPLGGYVKMVDEREGDVLPEDLPFAFTQKTVWQRMAIVLAGPAANFLLAILIYWALFLQGVTGIVPIIGSISPDSIADKAGLKVGHQIVAVDGKKTPTWRKFHEQLLGRMGESGVISFTVKLPGEPAYYKHHGQLENWMAGDEKLNPLSSIGVVPYAPAVTPRADTIVPGSPAAQAGLISGDLLLSADNLPLTEWAAWVAYVRDRPEVTIDIKVKRENDVFYTKITPKKIVSDAGDVFGQVGISVKSVDWPENMYFNVEYGPLGALAEAFSRTWATSVMILDSVKKMLIGDISIKHLSGPISIGKVAGKSAEYGLAAYLGFLALLSVSLGIMNLLPIPVLDGGHFLYFVIEAIKGSPLPERIQMLGFRAGIFLVVGLMSLALYNDILN
jgi:regulator of sigma E protease